MARPLKPLRIFLALKGPRVVSTEQNICPELWKQISWIRETTMNLIAYPQIAKKLIGRMKLL
ncbi:hypothetical protein AOT96_22360 [Rhodococcus sp. 008]|nr:hypothetical protein AOT96_22360 [Rhodococcus sp. 008]